jgi:hypothetical protein
VFGGISKPVDREVNSFSFDQAGGQVVAVVNKLTAWFNE